MLLTEITFIYSSDTVINLTKNTCPTATWTTIRLLEARRAADNTAVRCPS